MSSWLTMLCPVHCLEKGIIGSTADITEQINWMFFSEILPAVVKTDISFLTALQRLFGEPLKNNSGRDMYLYKVQRKIFFKA